LPGQAPEGGHAGGLAIGSAGPERATFNRRSRWAGGSAASVLSLSATGPSTASGKLIFHIFTALAEFERSLIQERTRAGLDAARARGQKGGRKRIDCTDPRVRMVDKLYAGGHSVKEICTTLKISRATLYRYLAAT
jgi:DNA invertase Pin-like site-specific DNA recombinase